LRDEPGRGLSEEDENKFCKRVLKEHKQRTGGSVTGK